MSILSDFFIASDCDAANYDGLSDLPAEDCAQYKNILPLEAAGLLAVLKGVPYQIEMADEFAMVEEGGDQGPWTVKFPDEMVQLLAGCSNADYSRLSEAWANVVDDPEWQSTDYEPIAQDLIRLAKRARDSGKSLFLWNSL